MPTLTKEDVPDYDQDGKTYELEGCTASVPAPPPPPTNTTSGGNSTDTNGGDGNGNSTTTNGGGNARPTGGGGANGGDSVGLTRVNRPINQSHASMDINRRFSTLYRQRASKELPYARTFTVSTFEQCTTPHNLTFHVHTGGSIQCWPSTDGLTRAN